MGLSDGRKSFPIGLAVLIQYRSVTATQPATQPASQPPSHVAVAITLNAKASSLKIQNGDILALANLGPPGKWPLNQREIYQPHKNYTCIFSLF